MKVGIRVPSPKRIALVKSSFLAQRAEALGFESIWFPEHPVLPVDTKPVYTTHMQDPEDWAHFPDPFIALAFAAAATRTIRIGTGICLLAQHDPLVLAKEIATLDRYSDGRVLLGIGAGWNQSEAEIFKVDFARRWAHTRETALVLKELWTKDVAQFEGHYYKFSPVWCYPKPAQSPHPPILIGSDGKNAFRHVVEWGDEWMPFGVPPQRLEEGRREFEARAREVGRDPATLRITMWAVEPERAVVKSYFDAGADRVVVRRVNQTNTEAEFAEDFERIASAVL